MASLQQIFGWFSRGLFPTQEQYKQTWQSFWHKSEKIPQSQIFGLQEIIESATRGLIYRPPVPTPNDLYTTYPDAKTGWASIVESTGTIWQCEVQQDGTRVWSDTGLKEFPENAVTKEYLVQYEEMGEATTFVGTATFSANGTPSNPVTATRLQAIVPNMAKPIVRISGTTTDSSVVHHAFLTIVKPDNTQVNLVTKAITFENDKFDLTLSFLDEIGYEYVETRVIIQAVSITVSVTTALTNVYLPIWVVNTLMFNDDIDSLPIMPGFFKENHAYAANSSPNTNICVNRYPVKAGEKYIYSGRAYWNALFIVKEDGSFVDIIGSSQLGSKEITIPEDGYLCCWSTNYLRIAKVSLSYNSNQGYAINPRISLLEKGVEDLNEETKQIPELSTQLNTLKALSDVTEAAYQYRTADKIVVVDNEWHSSRIGINVPVASLNKNSKVYLQIKSLNAANPGSFFKYSATNVGAIVWGKEKVNGYYYSNIQEYSFTDEELQANAQNGKIFLFIQVAKNPLSPDELYISENSYIRQSASQLVTGSFDLFGYANNKVLTINAGTVATRLSAKIPVELFNNKDLDVYVQFQAANNTNNGKASLFYNSTSVGALLFNETTKQTELRKLTIPFSATTGKDFVDVILQFNNPAGLNADTITWLQFYMIGNRIDLLSKRVDELQTGSDTTLIQKTFEIPFRGYSAMTPVKVKKDGTGDFKTIQEAINSIKDASVMKQYDIQVYDDFYITDLKDLWIVNNPTQKNINDNPTSSIALVITKDWVFVRGMKGGGNILYIESPEDLASGSFQNIQTIYPMGNSGIDNFYVGIKGGRYAIHQESGGSKTHLDYHAHTLYQNLVVEHKGNQDYVNGSGWTSVMAQANGTTSGTKMTYINCKWKAPHAIPFYTHTAAGFDEPNDLTMINCSMVSTLKNITVASFGAYWGDIGSGQKSTIKFIGCNIPRFNCMGGGSSRGLEQTMTTANLWNNGGSRLLGYGNTPMAVNSWTPSVLAFQTINENSNVEVVGGTAKDLIFGDVYKSYPGTIDAKGLLLGSIRIENPITWASDKPSQIFGLPYRLGNCATNPKTLIVKVDGTEYTITFDKNYMTADGSAYSYNTTPAISNQQIINDINALFPAIFKSVIGASTEIGTFEDCQEIGINVDNSTLLLGMSVVRDYTGIQAWRRANEGEIAEGIVAERINQSGNILNSGRIILANKALFAGSTLGATNIAGGKMYKVNPNGYLWETTDKALASFIAVDNAYLKFYEK